MTKISYDHGTKYSFNTSWDQENSAAKIELQIDNIDRKKESFESFFLDDSDENFHPFNLEILVKSGAIKLRVFVLGEVYRKYSGIQTEKTTKIFRKKIYEEQLENASTNFSHTFYVRYII